MFPLTAKWRAAFAACLVVAIAIATSPSLAQEQDGGDVAARVSELEAEIAELKVMVGPLESLIRSKPSLAPEQESGAEASPAEDDLRTRVGALETQIGALTNQVEQIGEQMRAAETKGSKTTHATAPAPVPQDTQNGTQNDTQPDIMPALRDDAPQAEADIDAAPAVSPVIPPAANDTDTSRARWYGPKPDTDDGAPQSITPPALATGALPDEVPQSLAALPDEKAQALYEQGYGNFLQHDYAGAEKAFSKLVADYPKDPLAGSAQYWVGESQYVRKQYQKAADTFLAGYRKYSASDKAPDALLRLGMSLAALGQKDAACSTFKELGDKFPDAPGDLHTQAKGAAGKAGC